MNSKSAFSKLVRLIITMMSYLILTIAISSLNNPQVRETLLLVNCAQFITGIYFFWIHPDKRLKMIWVPFVVVAALSWIILGMHETKTIGSLMKDYAAIALMVHIFILAFQAMLGIGETEIVK